MIIAAYLIARNVFIIVQTAPVLLSKSRGSDTVWVRPPPSAPQKQSQKDIMSIWSAAKRVCRISANPFSYSIVRDMPVF